MKEKKKLSPEATAEFAEKIATLDALSFLNRPSLGLVKDGKPTALYIKAICDVLPGLGYDKQWIAAELKPVLEEKYIKTA